VLHESLLRKDFTVPLFGGYLRAQHPLASFVDDA
jgi:hypothetical protein